MVKAEIKKIKKMDNEEEKIYNYLHKNFEKIFIKLVFPYFRFEIMLQTINDIAENISEYPPIIKQKVNILKHISDKLKIICLYFNIALDEYNKLIMYVEKNLK